MTSLLTTALPSMYTAVRVEGTSGTVGGAGIGDNPPWLWSWSRRRLCINSTSKQRSTVEVASPVSTASTGDTAGEIVPPDPAGAGALGSRTSRRHLSRVLFIGLPCSEVHQAPVSREDKFPHAWGYNSAKVS